MKLGDVPYKGSGLPATKIVTAYFSSTIPLIHTSPSTKIIGVDMLVDTNGL